MRKVWLVSIVALSLSCGGSSGGEQAEPLLSVTTPSNLPSALVGEAYQAFLEVDDPPPGVNWTFNSALPEGLAGANQGSRAVIRGIPTSTGQATIEVSVSAPGYTSVETSFSLAINDPFAWTTSEVPDAELDTAYMTTLEVQGGADGAIEWRLIQGDLPPGLSLQGGARTAQITGTPTEAGTFEFTVQVEDSAGQTASRAFGIGVVGRPMVTTAALPVAMPGTTYMTSVQASGGTGDYTWSVGGMPSWLTAMPAGPEVVLTGLVSSPGPFTLVFEVTDEAGESTQQSLLLQVADVPPLVVQGQAPAVMSTCRPNAATFSASGGVEGTYQWEVVSNGPLGGLEFSANGPGAELRGNPDRAGQYRATVEVEDLFGNTATAEVTYEVEGPSRYWTAVERVVLGQFDAEYALINTCGTNPGNPLPLRLGSGTHPQSQGLTPLYFTADGGSLLYAPVSERSGLFEGRLFDLNNPGLGGGVQVTHTPTTGAYLTGAAISPNGHWIAYSGALDNDTYQVFARDISNPTAPGPVFTQNLGEYLASLRPGFNSTGTALAYHPRTRLVQAAGLNLLRFDSGTPVAETIWTPASGDEVSDLATRWSPNGRYLVFITRQQTQIRRRLYVVDTQAPSPVSPRLLTSIFPAVNGFAISPDSRWVAFTVPRDADPTSERLFVIRLDVPSAAPVELDRGDEGRAFYAWAPFSDRLAYTGGLADFSAGIYYVDVSIAQGVGPRQTLIQKAPVASTQFSLLWSPDGNWLAGETWELDAFRETWLWQMTATPQGFIVANQPDGVRPVTFSAASDLLWLEDSGVTDGWRLSVVDLTQPIPRAVNFPPLPDDFLFPSYREFSPDGRQAYGTVLDRAGSRDGSRFARFQVDQNNVPMTPQFMDAQGYARAQYRFAVSPAR